MILDLRGCYTWGVRSFASREMYLVFRIRQNWTRNALTGETSAALHFLQSDYRRPLSAATS